MNHILSINFTHADTIAPRYEALPDRSIAASSTIEPVRGALPAHHPPYRGAMDVLSALVDKRMHSEYYCLTINDFNSLIAACCPGAALLCPRAVFVAFASIEG